MFFLKDTISCPILVIVILYFPEKGCHLGTNRSDNET